jgi:hypothetical protein
MIRGAKALIGRLIMLVLCQLILEEVNNIPRPGESITFSSQGAPLGTLKPN